MPERTYTTHDIARFCDVYPSSVINWINSGKLKSYSTPGGHHRMLRPDVISFLQSLNMPLPAELAERPMRVLIVDDDVEVTRVLVRAFAKLAPEIPGRPQSRTRMSMASCWSTPSACSPSSA